jgi:hypothetical protein
MSPWLLPTAIRYPPTAETYYAGNR